MACPIFDLYQKVKAYLLKLAADAAQRLLADTKKGSDTTQRHPLQYMQVLQQ